MRRALGKGLSQLIGEQLEGSVTEVPLASIVPNTRQPRTRFADDRLEELANSIREVGIIQPLVVRPTTQGHYELIAGERRWRAATLAGLARVPVVVRSASEQKSLEMALIENIQREDISAIEAGLAYQKLIAEFGLTQEKLAQRVGRSRVAIANTLRLLRLPKRIQEAIVEDLISEGHARALLALDSPERQLAVFDLILERGLSVRDVEKLTQKESAEKRKTPPTSQYLSAERAELEERISQALGSPVKIKLSGEGGHLMVDFFSEEDFQRLLDALGIQL